MAKSFRHNHVTRMTRHIDDYADNGKEDAHILVHRQDKGKYQYYSKLYVNEYTFFI